MRDIMNMIYGHVPPEAARPLDLSASPRRGEMRDIMNMICSLYHSYRINDNRIRSPRLPSLRHDRTRFFSLAALL
jgi:hypothetical protein